MSKIIWTIILAAAAYIGVVEWSAYKCEEAGGKVGSLARLECVR